MRLNGRITKLEELVEPTAQDLLRNVQEAALSQLPGADRSAVQSARHGQGRKSTEAEASAIGRYRAILTSALDEVSAEDLDRMIEAAEAVSSQGRKQGLFAEVQDEGARCV